MKKIITLALSVIMAVSMTVAASAAFVSSPSANAAPSIDKVTAEVEKDLKLEITAYKDREDLDTDAKKAIEDSYAEIKAATDLTTLTADLKTVAEKADVKLADLAVKDLFDISVVDGEYEGKLTISLSATTLKNFVALLHNNNGKWEVVKDAKVNADGTGITFSTDGLSPFAIVVNNPADVDSPATSDAFDFTIGFVVGAALFGAVAVVCFVKSKKRVNG